MAKIERKLPMALYELRTYTLRVGAMPEAVKLYQELGFPALQKGGHDRRLIGYFQSDTGTINQLVHCGNLRTTQIAARIGPRFLRTRTSWRVSPRNSAR
jgi:hypothetical protein